MLGGTKVKGIQYEYKHSFGDKLLEISMVKVIMSKGNHPMTDSLKEVLLLQSVAVFYGDRVVPLIGKSRLELLVLPERWWLSETILKGMDEKGLFA